MRHMVSIFKNIRDASVSFIRSLDYVLARIREGKSAKLIEQIRECEDKGERNALKEGLPCICFSGTFKHRSKVGLVSHSGLICLDFDDFESDEILAEWWSKIIDWEYTLAAFLSPSGKGLKVVVRIPPEPERHADYFHSLRDHWDCPYFDKSTSDYSRVCYESHDPELYHNPDAPQWTEAYEPDEESLGHGPAIPFKVTSDSDIVNKLDKWYNRKFTKADGRNNNIYRFANALNSFGVPQHVAERHLAQYAEPSGSHPFTEKEILNSVASAYRHVDRFRTRFFEDERGKQRLEKAIRSGRPEKEIRKEFAEELGDKVGQAIEGAKASIAIADFWRHKEQGGIQIIPHRYKSFLGQNHFVKYYPEGSKNFVFVRIDSNLVSDVSPAQIKDFVLEYLEKRKDIGLEPYDFMADNPKYFKDDYLSLIKTQNLEFKHDTEKSCFLYYKNCVVEVEADYIRCFDYMDLEGFSWARHVIDREYQQTPERGGVFQDFVWKIAGEDQSRFDSLRSVAGYLLHSHKTSANNRAIIFNDEVISDNPNGGSGKGLFCTGIGYMKRTAVLDGKQFSFDKSFPYQTVSTDTQVLVFDDVKKNFAFESLFSLITEGITLEKKNKDAIYIPVARSPKIVINTNYTIGGVGGSHERRKFEVELSGYFGVHHTPLDEFGAMLFSSWDAVEWRRFDAFMIGCVQFYLKNGLVAVTHKNLDVRKFIK